MAQPAPKRRCFISYCHDGIERQTLEYVVHVLRDTLGNDADVLFDVNVRYGDDFGKFMELLETVDVVVIILTPAYRQRVLDRRGGVYEEYTRIWNRYVELRPRDSHGRDRFDLLPILFAGTYDSATPDEIRPLKQLDLTGLRVTRKPTGQYILPHHVRVKYEPPLKQLASQIHAAAAVESDEFVRLAKSYYDRLFVDLKANFDEPTFAGHDYVKSIWVKTHAYNRIESQLAFFVIGRKGSGKSTMTQVLPLIHPERYEGIIKIIADEFNLETLYSLYSDQQFRSDVSAAVPRDRAFEFTWEAVLMLATMEKLVELMAADALTHVQLRQGEAIRTFMGKVKGGEGGDAATEWQPAHLFNFAFDATMRFVKDCIGGAREDPTFFLADIGVRFNRDRYLESVFGRDIVAAFRKLMQTFTRKFLVTLDGFDTAFDRFRQDSIWTGDESNIRRRALFEVDWLRSLLSLAMHAKESTHDFFFATLDFCIAAPKDRFLEVKRVERDSYRHWHRWCALNWSGIELAILLRKRMEVLAHYETDKEHSPQARLEEVLTRKPFNKLPVTIDFTYNAKEYRMPLFMYVLRHTFWRPREVLLYYAALLALSEEMGRWNFDITTDIVRKCVKATTKRVIESEFLNEFQSTVVNIRDIIHGFRRAPGVMSYEQLRERIVALDFKFASGGLGAADTREKIQFLYEIGFIGVCADTHVRDEFGLNLEHAFAFNEGQAALFSADDDEMQRWEFVIHPIFSEYLRLDMHDRELTLRYTWEYLHIGEALFAASPYV